MYHVRATKNAMEVGGQAMLIAGENQDAEWFEEKGRKNKVGFYWHPPEYSSFKKLVRIFHMFQEKEHFHLPESILKLGEKLF